VLLFAVLTLSFNLIVSHIKDDHEYTSYILMNRVFDDISGELYKRYHDESPAGDYGVVDRVSEISEEDVSSCDENATDCASIDELMSGIIDKYLNENAAALKKTYGEASFPDRIYYLSANAGEGDVSLINTDKDDSKIWALYQNDTVVGFVVFEFDDGRFEVLRKIMNIFMGLAFLITISVCIYIYRYVLKPFSEFSSYPEKLSKNQLTEKLPETKNRLFGRFTWGINMLGDKLEDDRKRIEKLGKEHISMVTTIAHGIKTPVSNIRLYADAISTGLYQPDGKPDEADAEIAAKICKNADDITGIVKELIEKASEGYMDYTPVTESFYLTEITDHLKEEYGRRLEVLRIPYSFEVKDNAIIKSDKDGIFRVLSQLIENAVKYGNGEGIRVLIRKEEDGYYFSVRNKGKAIEKNELPYIFNSYWRGSNSEGIEGSGIGLFESSHIVKKLYGDIYARRDESMDETEFEFYIPGASYSDN